MLLIAPPINKLRAMNVVDRSADQNAAMRKQFHGRDYRADMTDGAVID
jgi:hypothetical protein